jgi:DnaA family protein
MQQLLLDLAPVAAPTLDNFAPGRNGEPLRALRAWLAGGGDPALYLWGPPGSGKTHLLSGAAAEAQSRGADVRFLTASALNAAHDWPRAPAWLVIDDVDALSAAGQAALFTLFNRAAQGELRLLLSAAIAPAGLTLREDVRTRLAAVLVFQLHPLDDDEKAQALQTHARGRGFELPPEAARYLLLHGRRDLRWLLAVLDALDRHSLQTRRPITLTLLREVLQAARTIRTAGASPSCLAQCMEHVGSAPRNANSLAVTNRTAKIAPGWSWFCDPLCSSCVSVVDAVFLRAGYCASNARHEHGHRWADRPQG